MEMKERLRKLLTKKALILKIVAVCAIAVVVIVVYQSIQKKRTAEVNEFSTNIKYLYDDIEFLKENNIMSAEQREEYTVELNNIKELGINGKVTKDAILELYNLDDQLTDMAKVNKKSIEDQLNYITSEGMKNEKKDIGKQIEKINNYINNGNYVDANEENIALAEMLKQRN